MTTVDNALARADQRWSIDTSHVDVEQCFLDRTALATEVRRLRDEMVDLEQELREAEREAGSLHRELVSAQHQLNDGWGD